MAIYDAFLINQNTVYTSVTITIKTLNYFQINHFNLKIRKLSPNRLCQTSYSFSYSIDPVKPRPIHLIQEDHNDWLLSVNYTSRKYPCLLISKYTKCALPSEMHHYSSVEGLPQFNLLKAYGRRPP